MIVVWRNSNSEKVLYEVKSKQMNYVQGTTDVFLVELKTVYFYCSFIN